MTASAHTTAMQARIEHDDFIDSSSPYEGEVCTADPWPLPPVKPAEHQWSWCSTCGRPCVICAKCGNGCCNGGYGTLPDGSACDRCPGAYEKQRIEMLDTFGRRMWCRWAWAVHYFYVARAAAWRGWDRLAGWLGGLAS